PPVSQTVTPPVVSPPPTPLTPLAQEVQRNDILNALQNWSSPSVGLLVDQLPAPGMQYVDAQGAPMSLADAVGAPATQQQFGTLSGLSGALPAIQQHARQVQGAEQTFNAFAPLIGASEQFSRN